jgi:hypothetical protein
MRRCSITRLMIVVGLSSVALVFLRGWLGRENWFGYLGLLALMVLIAWIGWLVTDGAVGRFFAGFGATGLALWFMVLIAPETILDICRDRLILPADRCFGPLTNSGDPRLEISFCWASIARCHADRRNRNTTAAWSYDRARLYGGNHELQGFLVIPPVVLSTVGGLIAAWFRPRRTTPPSPTPPP